MIQKITEHYVVLIGLVVVMLALYSCAFSRIWRERKHKAGLIKGHPHRANAAHSSSAPHSNNAAPHRT